MLGTLAHIAWLYVSCQYIYEIVQSLALILEYTISNISARLSSVKARHWSKHQNRKYRKLVK